MPRSLSAALAFGGLVLGCVSVARACGSHIPDSFATLPGMGFYRPDLLFLFPLLSGPLERPFYTFAGYRMATLGYSIQANFLASIIVGVVGFVGYGFIWDSPGILLLLIGAPVVGTIVKLWWFRRVPREDSDVNRVGWFALATISSTVIIALIPVGMYAFGTDRMDWAIRVRSANVIGGIATFAAAVLTHVCLFTRLRRGPVPDDPRRGFEVMPVPEPIDLPMAARIAPSV